MSDDKPPKSPANRNVRTAVAAVFVAIWLVVVLYDFFAVPDQDVVPLWFQATGLLVLGFLLGVSFDDLRNQR
jgi:protein-S-isoprenylcysteine O-methyltransferase Ste14